MMQIEIYKKRTGNDSEIAVLTTAKNTKNAKRYLDYLATGGAQNIYASYGFVKASQKDLELKKIPFFVDNIFISLRY